MTMMCVVELMMTGAPTLRTTSDIWLDFLALFTFTLGINNSEATTCPQLKTKLCARGAQQTPTLPIWFPLAGFRDRFSVYVRVYYTCIVYTRIYLYIRVYYTCQRDVGDVSGSTSGCHKTRWLDLQAGDALHHLKSSSRRLDLKAHSHSDLAEYW